MKPKQALRWLNKNKHLVGLSDWYIQVLSEYMDLDGVEANVIVSLPDKQLRLSLSKEFKGFDKQKCMSVLFHELLHARYNIYTQKINEVTSSLEEEYINDLELGLNHLLN